MRPSPHLSTPRPSVRLLAHGVLLTLLGVTLAGCTTSADTLREAERLAQVLGLEPGMQVADVGAGEGRWSTELANQVGPTGRVWSTEIDSSDVEDLERKFTRAGLDQATAVLGSATDTGLPEDCCDAIFLRLVYHHFTDPEAMRDSLKRALRPGGKLAIMDIEIQENWGELTGVPDRGGHGIPQKQLIEEMAGDGFEVVAQHTDWPGDEDHYLVVFQVCG